ncbi:MAG: hypothetical protein ACLQU3_29240 [Limisphaerales bacterium]
MRTVICVLAAALLASGLPFSSEAKSYSSGGGHSYSSHRSSFGGSNSFSSGSGHSFSSGSSHSSSGGSTHSSSFGSGSYRANSGEGVGQSHGFGLSQGLGFGNGGGKHFDSGSGRSYSSGSTWSENGRHSYTSGKSYSSGAGHIFASSSGSDRSPREPQSAYSPRSDSSSTPLTFDAAAAHARKEEASKAKFTQFRDAQLPPPATPGETPRSASSPSYRVQAPPLLTSGGGSYRSVVYVPDAVTISSRPARIYSVFNPYYSRPVVIYRDPYNSLFWWWLLDRSLEDRASWAYHHRYDMDPERYQALVANDQQLEARVEQLEAQQAPRDPNYVPPGVDRDLMYSDHYVARSYSNRPTAAGVFAFWLLAVPTALCVTGFFIWLIWFKRWQTAT